ncbi:hypothetical protein HGRIS_012701 [Hohenbuehelia grisea]|uniref:Carboxylic ester hydrolase n=1 Tax=Hohenbuehelia grisea TaxID=104357 RepID=A0ABR3IT94_9AGAR
MNYRLNAFGFLASKEVQEDGITNLGFHDQRLALKWVQKYISSFGGDPNQVTVWGHSAGAASVALHLVAFDGNSDALFHRAFMHSGGPWRLPHVLDGQGDYDFLVSETNCSAQADTLSCLRHAPYEDMLAAINRTANVFSYQSLNFAWTPRIDGAMIQRQPYESLVQGKYLKVPTLAGNCDDEGTLFSFSTLNLTTSHEFSSYINRIYLPTADTSQMRAVLEAYPDDPAQGSPFGTGDQNIVGPQFKRMAAFQTDLIFMGPRRFFLQATSSNMATWSFLIKRGKNTPGVGAAHISDLPLWTAARTIADYFPADALIHFINVGDPNINSAAHGGASESRNLTLYWPQWGTGNSSSLLVLSDPDQAIIGRDDFRAQPIALLNQLQLHLPLWN